MMVNLLVNCVRTLTRGLVYTVQNKNIVRPIFLSSRILYHSAEENLDPEIETKPINYINRDFEFGFGKRFAVKKIKELFNINELQAQNIALSNRELWKVTPQLMSTNYYLMREEGVPDEIILKFISLLAEDKLEKKIRLLKTLWIPISECLPLALLDMKWLNLLIENKNEKLVDRIDFFVNLFKLPTIEVCHLLVKKKFLRSIQFEKAERNFHLILGYGITKEELIKDLWALRYGTEVIYRKLETGKKSNIGKLKTWMIRANRTIFEGYIKRRAENKEILGESSVAEYLSERLQCTPEQIQVIINRHPALEHKSMPKLDATINYIYSAGFQPFQIVRAPKILLHSMETTKARLEELSKVGVRVDSLYILTKSQKQYLKHFELLKTKGQEK